MCRVRGCVFGGVCVGARLPFDSCRAFYVAFAISERRVRHVARFSFFSPPHQRIDETVIIPFPIIPPPVLPSARTARTCRPSGHPHPSQRLNGTNLPALWTQQAELAAVTQNLVSASADNERNLQVAKTDLQTALAEEKQAFAHAQDYTRRLAEQAATQVRAQQQAQQQAAATAQQQAAQQQLPPTQGPNTTPPPAALLHQAAAQKTALKPGGAARAFLQTAADSSSSSFASDKISAASDDRAAKLLAVNTKLSAAERRTTDLEERAAAAERELAALQQLVQGLREIAAGQGLVLKKHGEEDADSLEAEADALEADEEGEDVDGTEGGAGALVERLGSGEAMKAEFFQGCKPETEGFQKMAAAAKKCRVYPQQK